MASRSQSFTIFPWGSEGTAGLNTSLDESLLQKGELTVADNLVFDYQSAKKKREGIDHDWDNTVFTVTSRSSSGTDRTLTGTFTNTGLVVGDRITITGAGNSSYNVTNAAITVINGTTITYTGSGSLNESSTADTTASWGNSIIGGIDYWVEDTGSKTQYIIQVFDNGAVLRSSGGTRTRITDAGTAWTIGTGLTRASCEIFNNKVFFAVDGANNVMKYWDGSNSANTIANVANAPEASIVRAHQGRLLCDDKEQLDRLHYCEAYDETKWNGTGDSGAIDVGQGDGDPSGITGISPTFKGEVFVGKRTKLYRIPGYLPDYQILKISDGIGFASHNSIVPVDQDDIFFASDRGIHSLAATDQFGSFSSQYVSSPIQRTINEDWSRSRRRYIQGAYVDELNSVVWAVSDNEDDENNALYLFNIPLKAWYRWPSLECQGLILANDSDRKRLYLGGTNGRLSQTLTGDAFDTDEDGVSQAILLRFSTGRLFLDDSPLTTKNLKKFGLIYKPEGSSTLVVTITVDNFSSQTLTFTSGDDLDLLGTTFILGQSLLGSDVVLSPYTQPVDGVGKGVKITVEQFGINDSAEIQGFHIDFQGGPVTQETRQGDSR